MKTKLSITLLFLLVAACSLEKTHTSHKIFSKKQYLKGRYFHGLKHLDKTIDKVQVVGRPHITSLTSKKPLIRPRAHSTKNPDEFSKNTVTSKVIQPNAWIITSKRANRVLPISKIWNSDRQEVLSTEQQLLAKKKRNNVWGVIFGAVTIILLLYGGGAPFILGLMLASFVTSLVFFFRALKF